MTNYYDINIFYDMLRVDFYEIKSRDYDSLVVCCGKEGEGKSRLVLLAIEFWLKEIMKYKDWDKRLKEAMGVKPLEWAMLLEKISLNRTHGAINCFDEAGDVISGKHSSTKFITTIEDTWKVIRGLNSETIINSPSLFILSPYIRNHRVRSVWYVERRGHCHVFYGERLRELIALNESKELKNMLAVEPNFSFIYPNYDGVFLPEYLEMKHNKMYQIITKLRDEAKNFES